MSLKKSLQRLRDLSQFTSTSKNKDTEDNELKKANFEKMQNLQKLYDINKVFKVEPAHALAMMEKDFPGSVKYVQDVVTDSKTKDRDWKQYTFEEKVDSKKDYFEKAIGMRLASLVAQNRLIPIFSDSESKERRDSNRMSLREEWLKERKTLKRPTIVDNSLFEDDEDEDDNDNDNVNDNKRAQNKDKTQLSGGARRKISRNSRKKTSSKPKKASRRKGERTSNPRKNTYRKSSKNKKVTRKVSKNCKIIRRSSNNCKYIRKISKVCTEKVKKRRRTRSK